MHRATRSGGGSSPAMGAETNSWQEARLACREVALGSRPPTLLVRGGRVFSLFTGELVQADVALCGDLIAGVGEYQPAGAQVLDASGMVILPGFIDAHMHVESSLLSPARYAEAVVIHGVTTVMAEPHELANVLGLPAVDFFLDARAKLPLDLRIMLPSSVPASSFEAGAVRLGRDDLVPFLGRPGVQGLGEVMDVPAVLGGGSVWGLLEASRHTIRDGHAPGITGRELAAYLVAGMTTDHETSDPALLLERRRLGMWLLAREGSAARDLDRVIPFLRAHGLARTALCTDDRHAGTLVDEHHIDGMVARLVGAGLPLRDSLAAASLAPAELYRLFDRGAVAPGLRGDLNLVEDPASPHPRMVIQAGRLTAKDDILQVPLPPTPVLPERPVRARIDPVLMTAGLGLEWRRVRAIRVLRGALFTGEDALTARIRGGAVEEEGGGDLALLSLLERHLGTGESGAGFVTGTGLRSGALASTVGHDAHQLIVLGRDLQSMVTAARAVAEAGGGLAVAERDQVLLLPLPLGGLMADRPAVEVAARLRELETRAVELGCSLPSPFMALSFLSLTVVPKLKMTVHGMLDVEQGRIVPSLLG